MVIDLQHLQHLQHLFSKVVFHVFDLEVYGNAVAGVAGVATCGRPPSAETQQPQTSTVGQLFR